MDSAEPNARRRRLFAPWKPEKARSRMPLVEQHVIARSDPHFAAIDAAAWKREESVPCRELSGAASRYFCAAIGRLRGPRSSAQAPRRLYRPAAQRLHCYGAPPGEELAGLLCGPCCLEGSPLQVHRPPEAAPVQGQDQGPRSADL